MKVKKFEKIINSVIDEFESDDRKKLDRVVEEFRALKSENKALKKENEALKTRQDSMAALYSNPSDDYDYEDENDLDEDEEEER